MINKKGTLFICPTPIGNLEDITLRCLRILKEVDYIAAEDTRITQKLLNHFEIKTPLISFHKFSEKKKAIDIIEKLNKGLSIALVSDAGTPLISDPGNDIVLSSINNQHKIIPLPGPSAVTCALSASGLISDGFVFYGFLPKSNTQKETILLNLSKTGLPIAFFESPHRVRSTLNCIYNLFGNINIFIARELTKLFEEITLKPIKEHIEYYENNNPRGEFTIIIDKIPQIHLSENEIDLLILDKINKEISVSNIAKELSDELNISKNLIYKKALKISKKPE